MKELDKEQLRYVETVAVTAANMLDGMRISGEDRPRWKAIVEDAWGQGFLELTQRLAEFAIISEDEVLRRAPQDFPGVYDYEVSYEFGHWLAEQAMVGDWPKRDVCQAKLMELIDRFFAQNEKAPA